MKTLIEVPIDKILWYFIVHSVQSVAFVCCVIGLKFYAADAVLPEKIMIYDTLIIGGGPAGYTAALYCARAALSVMVLEKLSPGGQMATTSVIDNYPGFEEGIDGFDLGMKMKACADRFDAKTELADVTDVDFTQPIKKITTSEGVFEGRTVIIATGASPRRLGLPEETILKGRGVAYCATCDGMLFKGRSVAVIGGGNSAVADALFLSKICTKVYLVHRRNTLRATPVYMNALRNTENIEFKWDSTVSNILYSDTNGQKLVTGLSLKNVKTGEPEDIACQGVFITVGRIPNTDVFKNAVRLDDTGYIIADESCKTDVPGVFAAGDVRTKVLRQIVNACADGATASKYAEDYLAEQKSLNEI
ncbi:MAG: thioredoxin-disulfide reductase [Spirochaetales bacterium]